MSTAQLLEQSPQVQNGAVTFEPGASFEAAPQGALLGSTKVQGNGQARETIEGRRDTTSALVAALERLENLGCLAPDWDSYGSAPPTVRAIGKARSLILLVVRSLLATAGRGSLPYSILPLSGGGVQLEWRGADASIEVQVSSGGGFGYLSFPNEGVAGTPTEEDDVAEGRILEKVTSVVC